MLRLLLTHLYLKSFQDEIDLVGIAGISYSRDRARQLAPEIGISIHSSKGQRRTNRVVPIPVAQSDFNTEEST